MDIPFPVILPDFLKFKTMSNHTNQQHIVKYSFYFKILIALLVLTAITVGVTSVELGPLTVAVALLIASIKAALVLLFFMHLKFDKKIFGIMAGTVIFVFIIVLVITFLDYYFR